MASAISSDDVEPNEVTIRGNDKSFRVESEAGKIYAVHFEQDDDNDDAGEKEDFTDDNEDLLSFQVESLQEKNSAGKSVLPVMSSQRHKIRTTETPSSQRDYINLKNIGIFTGICLYWRRETEKQQ